MRKFVYAVAAVLAVAPLAAIAPASAVVQNRAVESACNGHPDELVTVNNLTNAGGVLGYWEVNTSSSVEASGSSGEVEDKYSASTEFCMTSTPPGGFKAFREEGTDNCATYDESAAPDNTVQMEPCDTSKPSQQWDVAADGAPWTNDYGSGCLDGNGADTPIYMRGCDGLPSQDWYW